MKAMQGVKTLVQSTINPRVVEAEYAVRGEIVLKAMELNAKLAQERETNAKTLPFDEIVFCNIGNPHSLLQKPITFPREVISLCDAPHILDHPKVGDLYSPDAIARARKVLGMVPGGTGAYSESQGLAFIRKNVAKFIEARDGYPSDPSRIFITNGASQGVSVLLQMLIRGGQDGIMIPIPQYPLYSATISLLGGRAVGYYLDESKDWSLDIAELERSVQAARKEGTEVRALAVINPGNPTGQVLDEDNICEILKFAQKEKMLVLADEVYQENVYSEGKQFHSFHKVHRKMDSPVELVSFHSVSKGVFGECGRRGGYLECYNLDSEAMAQLYKLLSIGLCSNLDGQLMVDLMVSPPVPGDPSYELYHSETRGIFESLQRRARMLSTALEAMDGISCRVVQGSMYAFPSIHLPPKAVAAAKAAGKSPDTFYALRLLGETGICVVPGSGFRQVEGTFHFRTTILPAEDKIALVTERLAVFQKKFMAEFA